MTSSGVMLSLPQMVDLALNTPEVGSVNFNILHSLLHVLIQQVDLLDTKVEFTGNDSERVQNLLHKTPVGPTLNLTEYVMTPNKDQQKVVSRKSRYKQGDEVGEIIVQKEHVIEKNKDAIDPMETVIVVETKENKNSSRGHISLALSNADINALKDEIERLKEDVKELKELPSNENLISAMRTNSSPVLDMFQILSLTKRMDAAEEGTAKMASMIEDLAKECATGEFSHTKSNAGDSPQGLDTDLNDKVSKLEERVKVLETNQQGETATKTQDNATKDFIVMDATQMTDAAGRGTTEGLEARVTELEDKFRQYTDYIATIDNTFNDQVAVLQQNMVDLEKEIGEIIERINAGLPAGDTGVSEQGGRELYDKVMSLQEELDKLAGTATKLLDEKQDRVGNMDALLEQIELLKTIKANREDLQDALANKADSCAVNRKVSHDQFDAACDELSHSIEDAVTKLTQQEQLWQQALLDIQNEIENKLDKMELTPLRDFVHNKLKMLQERLKALTGLKQDTEAAGTKSRLLRNVNCISCDKDVVMRKEIDPSFNPPPPSLPPTKSIGPYLAYELDQLRKQQKCAPHGRNMNYLENAISSNKGEKKDHICNRYCGGSHTTTTPQQRVTRLGHFLQQWGPESIITEGDIRGTDGQMYKTRDQFEQNQVGITPVSNTQYMKTKPSMTVTSDILSERGKSSKPNAGDVKPPLISSKSK